MDNKKWVLIEREDLEEMEKSLLDLEKIVQGCFYPHDQSEMESFEIKKIDGVYNLG